MGPQKILHAFHFQIREITASLLYWDQAETHSVTKPEFKYDPQSYLKSKLWFTPQSPSNIHTCIFSQKLC